MLQIITSKCFFYELGSTEIHSKHQKILSRPVDYKTAEVKLEIRKGLWSANEVEWQRRRRKERGDCSNKKIQLAVWLNEPNAKKLLFRN